MAKNIVAEEEKPQVFLGGECQTDWRDEVIEDLGDELDFIDPEDPDWDPAENIYDELADICDLSNTCITQNQTCWNTLYLTQIELYGTQLELNETKEDLGTCLLALETLNDTLLNEIQVLEQEKASLIILLEDCEDDNDYQRGEQSETCHSAQREVL